MGSFVAPVAAKRIIKKSWDPRMESLY